jgi:hypothetical protein
MIASASNLTDVAGAGAGDVEKCALAVFEYRSLLTQGSAVTARDIDNWMSE